MNKEILFSSLNLEELEALVQNSVRKVLAEQQPEKKYLQQVDILNLQEASEFINLAKPTIYGLVNQRKIPYYKNGKKLYFKRSELQSWIEAGKHKTIAEIEEDSLKDFKNSRPSKQI